MAVAAMASGGEMIAPRTNPAASGRLNEIVREIRDRHGGEQNEADGEQ